MKILVLCTGNSARSILLESILNHASNGRVAAYSAGSHPVGKVHPHAIKLLNAKGYDTSAARSKIWDEFTGAAAPKFDLVITVCGNAAGEVCPIWNANPLSCHWGVDDPADCVDDCDAAFAQAYKTLSYRSALLLDLAFEDMTAAELAPLLEQIGTK